MNRKTCQEILTEIQDQVLATPSQLCWNIARELADYTVAFVVLNDGQLSPAGTGTLVSFHGSHYFLTAAHVWEKLLKKSDAICIPLKENAPCQFSIRPKDVASYSTPIPVEWIEWGPDIALLLIPPERVGSFIAAGRPFYPLSVKRERLLDCALHTWFLMGAPAIRGHFTAESAIPELQGMNVVLDSEAYSSTELSGQLREQLDFIDIFIDTSQPDVAPNFKGVSGGGLWHVYIFKDDEGEIRSFKILAGVAFWQEIRESSLLVRCHGPQSVGSVLWRLYD